MKKILSFIFVLILLVIGTSVVFGQFKGTFSFNFTTTPIEQEETVNGKSVDTIEIHATSADIKVISVDRDNIYVRLSGDISENNKDKYKLKVEEVDGNVHIEIEQPKMEFQVGVNITSLKLEVEVPEQAYKKLSIYSISSDIQLSGLQVEALKTELSSGDIKVEGVNVKDDYSIELISGDVHIENTEAKAISIEGSSGDITFKETLGDVQLKTISGDINIWNLKGNINVETTSGDIEIENERLTGNIEVVVTSGDVSVRFDETPESLVVDYEGLSGKGSVNLEGITYEEENDRRIVGKVGMGDYSLKVRTTSGDFRLK